MLTYEILNECTVRAVETGKQWNTPSMVRFRDREKGIVVDCPFTPELIKELGEVGLVEAVRPMAEDEVARLLQQ